MSLPRTERAPDPAKRTLPTTSRLPTTIPTRAVRRPEELEPGQGHADDEPPASPPPPHPAGGETVEYDVEEALGSERHPPPAGDEDVLEETPEFLQDTPDHDRLWFEQRPPKDFDFDG